MRNNPENCYSLVFCSYVPSIHPSVCGVPRCFSILWIKDRFLAQHRAFLFLMESIKTRIIHAEVKTKLGLKVWSWNVEPAKTAPCVTHRPITSLRLWQADKGKTYTDKQQKLSVLGYCYPNQLRLLSLRSAMGSVWHGWRGAVACVPARMPVISAWSWSCHHMDSWFRAAGPHESPYHNILLYHQQVCTLHS